MAHFLSNLIRLFYSDRTEWVIAIRKRTNTSLYEGNLKDFCIVRNKKGFWHADPFLYEFAGKTFLFVERYNKKLGKGEIAVAEVKKGRVKKFKTCLALPFHLSYPCIFDYQGDIVMCPESHQNGKISLYRTRNFPMEWSESELVCAVCAADTTPCWMGKQMIFFSTIYRSSKAEDIIDDNLCIIKDGVVYPIKRGNNLRMAGMTFVHDGKIIRPCQCNQSSYGEALDFRYVDCGDAIHGIEEHSFFKVFPPHLNDHSIELSKSFGYKEFLGVHTYNKSSRYEVVDLKVKARPGLMNFVVNLLKFLARKF